MLPCDHTLWTDLWLFRMYMFMAHNDHDHNCDRYNDHVLWLWPCPQLYTWLSRWLHVWLLLWQSLCLLGYLCGFCCVCRHFQYLNITVLVTVDAMMNLPVPVPEPVPVHVPVTEHVPEPMPVTLTTKFDMRCDHASWQRLLTIPCDHELWLVTTHYGYELWPIGILITVTHYEHDQYQNLWICPQPRPWQWLLG